ncbi:DUF3788 domain-containing protein [Labilibaculum sp. DW002]|uniref:DUF3788 domain-containing protein n=1 Tax=Paralabilibaculum antarcticum TaxID=2912572 RepID=A0ABT5VW35_9BACT|nr:DUF3788 family protein [Labilibaculum sp. DW002]MDE5419635.1 DUF3788 domain-containing protein [Labilibaculum sp. DW002]
MAFVFGQKASDQIMASNITQVIKEDLANAKKYVEGRGVSIEVHNSDLLSDINQLIDTKLAN